MRSQSGQKRQMLGSLGHEVILFSCVNVSVSNLYFKNVFCLKKGVKMMPGEMFAINNNTIKYIVSGFL